MPKQRYYLFIRATEEEFDRFKGEYEALVGALELYGIDYSASEEDEDVR